MSKGAKLKQCYEEASSFAWARHEQVMFEYGENMRVGDPLFGLLYTNLHFGALEQVELEFERNVQKCFADFSNSPPTTPNYPPPGTPTPIAPTPFVPPPGGGCPLGGGDPIIPTCPLILDLDGDGVEANKIGYFDHGGDGFFELTAWVGEDDGMLVWDRNGDGIINDGSELFGNNSVLENGEKAAHGFAALSELDENGDGVVDASDAAWSSLQVQVWVDIDGDGVKEGRALVSLESLNVSSLNTGFINSDHVDDLGNAHRQVGSYTNSDGVERTMTDVWLASSQLHTVYYGSEIPVHSEAIAALPNVVANGRVYNLRDAMALDDAVDAEGNSLLVSPYYSNTRTEMRSLRELVEAFSSEAMANDKAGREALAEKILLRWTGAEEAVGRDYSWRQTLTYTTAQKIAVIEAFQGAQWREGERVRNPAYSTVQKIEKHYFSYYERLYGELMLQTHLSDLVDSLEMVSLVSESESSVPSEGESEGSSDINGYRLDFSGVMVILASEGNARRGEFLRSLAAIYGSWDWLLSSLEASSPSLVYEYRYYAEYSEDGVFDASVSAGNDFIGDCGCSDGSDGVNVFQTTDGGSDRLEGRGGDDVYHLGYGTGHDRIEEEHRDSDYGGDAGDVIRIAPGISSDRVRLSRLGSHLTVSIVGTDGVVNDSLEVAHFYSNPVARIERVEAEDGTVWVETDMEVAPYSSGRGSTAADVYDGSWDGEDRVLQGGSGADVYRLGRNFGHDVVDERAYRAFGDDTLGGDVVRLSAGLTSADVHLSRVRRDLVIGVLSVDGSSVDSSLTIRDYYAHEEARIERVELSDGTLLWAVSDLLAAPYSSGQGSIGSDTYDGSRDGQDSVLEGGSGADIYQFGRGSGHDVIDESVYRDRGELTSDGDIVRLSAGLTASEVRLSRSRYDVVIELLSADGNVVDSTLTVRNYYLSDVAQIERVELSDGTLLWGAGDLAGAVLSDASDGDDVVAGLGRERSDVLSGMNGGSDTLRGLGGNDVYLFGFGSGHDVVDERYQNSDNDGLDTVRLSLGIVASQVSLSRT